MYEWINNKNGQTDEETELHEQQQKSEPHFPPPLLKIGEACEYI